MYNASHKRSSFYISLFKVSSPLRHFFAGLIMNPAPHQGKDDSSHGIADGHGQQINNCLAAPRARHDKEKHISHTMFKAAQNKNHHAQKQRKVFPYFVVNIIITLRGNINKGPIEKSTAPSGVEERNSSKEENPA